MPTKTVNQVLGEADQAAQIILQIKTLEAARDEKILAVKTKFSADIDARKKSLTSLKTKVRNWLKKQAPKLFPESKTSTGIHKSEVSEIRWNKNPDSIVKIDKDMSDEDLVNLAIQKGHEDAVRITQEPNKEHLATLTEDELTALGWKKESGRTLEIKPLASGKKTEALAKEKTEAT